MNNFESIVLLLIGGQGILLSLGLISSVIKKHYSNFFLGLITMVFTLEVLNAWGMEVGYHSSGDAVPFWTLGSYLILAPAILLFIRANINPEEKLRPWHFLLFFPASIEILAEIFTFYSNRLSGTDYHLIQNSTWFAFTEVLPIISMLAVLGICWRKLLMLFRSTGVPATAKHLTNSVKFVSFLVLFSLLTLLWIFQGIIGYQVFSLIEVILSAFLFLLGYVGYFSPFFFDVPQIERARTFKEEYSRYNDADELARLGALFDDEKVYVKPRLTLDELAQQLNLPARYLSGLINSYHESDFRNFVNSYRVREAIKRIQDPRENHKTLLAIAMESGFSSKSSFNQIFKAHTGQTPSDFLVK